MLRSRHVRSFRFLALYCFTRIEDQIDRLLFCAQSSKVIRISHKYTTSNGNTATMHTILSTFGFVLIDTDTIL